ncbi:hypothetical protein H3S89_08700 [Bartonella sp. B10834G6]|uniref:hypothetical protein n=1 Tax=Bartonella apis TaxID=1686310 RepID=UPI0018DE50C5|nr:hypothetical protein [Bartonella apis]MBH9982868.1 hypothetical protein [Bartonella apis]
MRIVVKTLPHLFVKLSAYSAALLAAGLSPLHSGFLRVFLNVKRTSPDTGKTLFGAGRK